MPGSTVLRLAPAALLVLAACASTAATSASARQGPSGALPPDSVRYATRYGWTPADARFMTDMVGHHAQAIAMSRLAPTRAGSPAIRTLAARIINAQRDEIASMQTWLRDRGQPVPQADTSSADPAPGAAQGGHEHHAGHDGMPGMLTPAQLQQLEASRGPVFDRLFLTFMIQHHRGATAMVERLFATDGAAQDEGVFKLASDINVDQVTEIARMERMLLDLLTEGGAP